MLRWSLLIRTFLWARAVNFVWDWQSYQLTSMNQLLLWSWQGFAFEQSLLGPDRVKLWKRLWLNDSVTNWLIRMICSTDIFLWTLPSLFSCQIYLLEDDAVDAMPLRGTWVLRMLLQLKKWWVMFCYIHQVFFSNKFDSHLIRYWFDSNWKWAKLLPFTFYSNPAKLYHKRKTKTRYCCES